jgi:PAB-dependent poly(A)-specific ribonuclease subunit 3
MPLPLQLEDLSHEMENGRLFRLATKLSFVTDRPADAHGGHGSAHNAAAYADSGDKYLLGLFRDFVFHQGEVEQGRVLDWGHVVETLNKVRKRVRKRVRVCEVRVRDRMME